jgi:pyruvate/2-oxoglutarate dehydrogenase complex dihydrolipoamide dehydrogenase (E3) component
VRQITVAELSSVLQSTVVSGGGKIAVETQFGSKRFLVSVSVIKARTRIKDGAECITL